MTRLERLRHQLDVLYKIRDMQLRQGQYLDAAETTRRIRDKETDVKEAEEYERLRKPVAVKDAVSPEELHEMGIIPLMIEAHLAADFLTAITYAIKDICKRHGFEDALFPQDLQDLLKKCDTFASGLIRLCPDLTDLLVDNDTLNEAIHKKYVSYITRKARQCDREKKKTQD